MVRAPPCDGMNRFIFAAVVCFLVALPARQFLDARQVAPAAQPPPPAAQQPPPPAAQAPPPAAPAQPGYAGSDTCALCHEDRANDVAHSIFAPPWEISQT